MSKLTINDEGFVDLRRNPPATRVQVQGGTEAPVLTEQVPIVPEPPSTKPPAPLPAVQRNAQGLKAVLAGPVKVPVKKEEPVLYRIDAADDSGCYAIVSKKDYYRLHQEKWQGSRTGHMWRRVVKPGGNVGDVVWLHRVIKRVNAADKFVAFIDGDERNLLGSNLKIVGSKEEVREVKRLALERRAYGKR